MMVGPLRPPGTAGMTEACERFILEALADQLCCSPELYAINTVLSDVSAGVVTLRIYDWYPVLRMMLHQTRFDEFFLSTLLQHIYLHPEFSYLCMYPLKVFIKTFGGLV